MNHWIATALTFFCSPLFALGVICGPDVAVRESVETWARSGADLERADLYEISTSRSEVRIPFLFPKPSALHAESFASLLKASKSVYWRSGRDINLENGMIALSEDGIFESEFDFVEGRGVVEGLQKAFDREFRMKPNGIARPIIQIVYPSSLELDFPTRDLLKKQARAATAVRLAKTDPIAVIFWGAEFLPSGNDGAVSMFDTIVSASHTVMLRAHFFPVSGAELTDGSVYPTIESSFLVREKRQ